MPVASNKNTQQAPIISGLSGTQVVRFIAADRVYIKASELLTPTPVNVKSNGSTPSGWTDLGIVAGKVGVAYTKETTEVRTGLENVLRDTYINQKNASFTFKLGQFDDVVLKEVSGLSASQIISSSVYRFRVGSEGIVKKALLLVTQDFLSGKEWHFYHPEAQIAFNLEDDGDATVVNVTANLPLFTYETGEVSFLASIFA